MPYCINIEKEIEQEQCPLEKGACYYQHRTTRNCKYSEFKSVTDFCMAVGLPIPNRDDLNLQIEDLRTQLKEEL